MPARIFGRRSPAAASRLDEFLDAQIGAIADHERQAGEFLIVENVDRRAVGGDDGNDAVLLPQAKRLALDDFDDQPSRIEFSHGGIFHQRHGEKLAPDVVHVEEGQRLAGVDPGRVENLLVVKLDLSGHGDGIDAETQVAGDQVARRPLSRTKASYSPPSLAP